MKKLSFLLLAFILSLSLAVVAFAHSGRTDSSGGHYNHSTGEYHYHHGNSAHDHYDIDGDGVDDCPYDIVGKIGIIFLLSCLILVMFGVYIYRLWKALLGLFFKHKETAVEIVSFVITIVIAVALAIVIALAL